MLDVGKLRLLRELSQRQTMSAVADAVCITASAVSQQLSNLEHEAGVALIERYGRGVRLTPAGKNLVAYADRVFAVLEEADAELSRMHGVLSGTVKIAAFSSTAVSLMPRIVTDLRDKHPALNIHLHDFEPAEGLAALRSWRIDLALIDDMFMSAPTDVGSIERHYLFTDELYAILPSGHRLSTSRTVQLCDLASENWALNAHTSAYYQAIVTACRAAGFEPSVNSSCRNVEVTLAMVASGCSVSVLPRLLTQRRRGELCVKRLSPTMTRKVDAAIRAGSSSDPAISTVLESLRHASREVYG
ncbi:LysR substrate-binding domain-containing protein [Cupriavidus sp. PET2-C1]